MRLPDDIYITNVKQVKDWFEIREQLLIDNSEDIWRKVFDEFYWARINERYLVPVKIIRKHRESTGEGYSIMAILCSLIEFLESTWQGINYRYGTRPAENEYRSSRDVFVSFLTARAPFSGEFNSELAGEFYEKVRCGVLHEARTKGQWIISATDVAVPIIRREGDKVRLNRNQFADAIEECVLLHYYNALLESVPVKQAFIRKWDAICSE